jgi:hypothetical protein
VTVLPRRLGRGAISMPSHASEGAAADCQGIVINCRMSRYRHRLSGCSRRPSRCHRRPSRCHHRPSWSGRRPSRCHRRPSGCSHGPLRCCRRPLRCRVDRRGAAANCQSLRCRRRLPKRFSLREVLIVEVINLDVMDLHASPTVDTNCHGL